MCGVHLRDSGTSPGLPAIRDAVARICDSRAFRSAPSLQAFLRFVVERTIAGDAASIKAYTVAVEALGRPPDFDPSGDAIVRVTAGRLRYALEQYYDSADDSVEISLPVGSYVPEFSWREDLRAPDLGAASVARQIFVERQARKAEFVSTLTQIRMSVAELHAEFAIARATMAQSKIIVERSRANAAEEPSTEASVI